MCEICQLGKTQGFLILYDFFSRCYFSLFVVKICTRDGKRVVGNTSSRDFFFVRPVRLRPFFEKVGGAISGGERKLGMEVVKGRVCSY